MQTTVIFKADKKLKERAQQTAKTLGVPFSSLMNNYLKQLVNEEQAIFSNYTALKPTPYLKRILKEGEENLKNGDVEIFNSVEEAFADLL